METGSTWQSHMEWVFPGSKDSRELKGGKLFGWQSHMQMHPSGAWQAARAGAYVCRPATECNWTVAAFLNFNNDEDSSSTWYY